MPPGNAPALARALSRLLDDPELQTRLGAQASATAEEFDVAPVTRRHASYFEELAEAGAQAGSRRATRVRMLVQPRSR